MSHRLGILVSHPIQYYAPWFRHLSERMDLEVFYAYRQDAAGQADAGFGVRFEWDVPLLEGYQYQWLKNVATRPGVGTFRGCDTPELYELINPKRFDAFLVFGWNRKSSWQAIRACWKSGVPVLMRGDSQLQTPRSALKRSLKYLPYRWLLPRIDAHLYVGQRNRDYLSHYGVPAERLFFCPHFVDNHFFSQAAARAVAEGRTRQIRAELGIPAEAFAFLFVGKLIPKKRPGDFIRACLKTFPTPNGADMHAFIVGDGPLRPELEQTAAPVNGRIHFAGFRNQTELPAYYAASNALVLPSEGSETWGLVVNEALACGIPCIVSDAVGCAPDLIEDGETGYRYPVGDVDALGQRLFAQKVTWQEQRQRIADAIEAKTREYSLARAFKGLAKALESTSATRPNAVTFRSTHPAVTEGSRQNGRQSIDPQVENA